MRAGSVGRGWTAHHGPSPMCGEEEGRSRRAGGWAPGRDVVAAHVDKEVKGASGFAAKSSTGSTRGRPARCRLQLDEPEDAKDPAT